MQQLLVKTRLADKDIVGRRVLTLDSESGKATMAKANTESLVGVATPLAVKKGKPVDFHVAGEVEAEAGGEIAYGSRLTSDKNGRVVAIKNANERQIGVALGTSAQAGDYLQILIVQA